MMRWCLLILLFPLFGRAQKLTAADVRQLQLYSSGFFSNDGQAKAGSGVRSAGLKLQPIWPQRKDGSWLFAERTDTGHHYQVWHYYLQDDTTLVMQFLDFKELQKAVALSADIKQQSRLFLQSLLARHGCEVYLKKNKMGYAGNSAGKDCFANAAGAEYTTFNISVTKNSISWQQTNFDKEDKELADVLHGNYQFIKQANASK